MKAVRFERAVILGVGLLGGSLAADMKRHGLARRVAGWGRHPARLAAAVRAGLLDEGTDHLGAAVCGADLIVLATPFERFEALIRHCAARAPRGCILTEVGSVKGPSVARWHRAAAPLRFVATHPMAGGEKGGFENARPGLFRGAACLLTPLPSSDREAVRRVGRLWARVGAQVCLCTPSEHDRLVARVSHLPHAAAFALASASRGRSAADFAFAGRGWADAARIAASDPVLWASIFLHHPSRIAKGLGRLESEVRRLRGLVLAGKPGPLRAFLARARAFRRATEGPWR